MKPIQKELSKSNSRKSKPGVKLFILVMGLFLLVPVKMFAHCDGVDGPVVKAAQQALEQKNVNLVLAWVQKADEEFIKKTFEKTLKLRAVNQEVRELADMNFFETLVRIHRAGEGAPYTGLKPAGRDLGPAIPAADASVKTGSPGEVWDLLSSAIHNRLHERFKALQEARNYSANDVEGGRKFVRAYVEYLHFVENVYKLGEESTKEHGQPESGHKH